MIVYTRDTCEESSLAFPLTHVCTVIRILLLEILQEFKLIDTGIGIKNLSILLHTMDYRSEVDKIVNSIYSIV